MNTAVALLQELVAVICGFVLPRLIMRSYGSVYNGLTTSITQFLSCAVLLRAGIGGATRAALYKPLAAHDAYQINAIMSATERFMKKIAMILMGLIVLFSCVYPFFVINEFDWLFSFSLFLIIGIGTFAESMFGISYLILLQADQKLYIASTIRIIVYILNTAVSYILVRFGAPIHIVKLGGSLAFCVYPLGVNIYVKKKYAIACSVPPDNKSVAQRWDVFWHQVANFVMNSTDTVVLTVFSNMALVSVYSVYNLVINGLKKLIMTFTNGLEGAFGNMIASDDKKVLIDNFHLIEYLMFCIAAIVNCCAWYLILDFVSLYTKGVADAQYLQPAFAAVIILAHYFNCVRQPYQLVVQAAGHYTQTKKGAIIEPILNILLSVLLVIRFGLIGVAVGTLAATMFRTLQYAYYVSKHIIEDAFIRLFKGLAISALTFMSQMLFQRFIPFRAPTSYLTWCLRAMIVFALSLLVTLVFSLVFYRKEFGRLVFKVGNIIRYR